MRVCALISANSTVTPCDLRVTVLWLVSVTETLLAAFTGSANETALTAAAPSAPNRMPSEFDAVVGPASLPVPNGSVAGVRPPSSTLPTTEPVSIGVSSVMVTSIEPAASVTALPSKSTASIRLDRSKVCGPLRSIGASNVTLHEPLSSRVSVNTSVPPPLGPPVVQAASVVPDPGVVVISASLTETPCELRWRPASTVLAFATNWNGVGLGPSAPNPDTNVSSSPDTPPLLVAEVGSLPTPYGSVPPCAVSTRPPSFTVPAKPAGVGVASSGVSSVIVTTMSPAGSVSELPSVSTAWTRPDRSTANGPLWLLSTGASSVTLHRPLLSIVMVKTAVPLAEPPV